MNKPTAAYLQLSDVEVERIHKTALDVLEKVGMADPPKFLIDVALEAGCQLNAKNRLCFPRSLVDDVIARARRLTLRRARDSERSLELSEQPVTYGHCGIAPMVVDLKQATTAMPC